MSTDTLPDYLPARMLNEFVYCPRLFYYEWVEGVFVDNRETVEGSLRHAKMDQKSDALPAAGEVAEGETIHSRSVTLSSETHRLIAKMDLIEGEGGVAAKGTGPFCRNGPEGASHKTDLSPLPPQVTPVDYKRGSPREGRDGELTAWDTDRVQLAVQALVLRENGYHCEEGVIYYVSTKQRVRVPIDEALVAETLDALARARQLAEDPHLPAPLVDSPKCPRCSLVTVCLPDETRAAAHSRPLAPREESRNSALRQSTLFDVEPPLRAVVGSGAVDEDVRRLVPARDDLRPLYLNTQGLRVGKTGNVLKVQEKDTVVQEVRIGEICQLNLLGNIQLSTQAVQALCEAEVPIAYFSMGGWFYGVTHGLGVKNIYLRREQFRLADVPGFCLRLARALVAGKIRNQRTMLQRNHIEPPPAALVQMKCMLEDAERAETMDELLGIEGNAARVYFENFSGMIKLDGKGDGDVLPEEGIGNREHEEDTAAQMRESAGNALRGVPSVEHGGIQKTNGRRANAFTFDFVHRNRRPPRDAVNALLSLAYSMLAKDLTIVCHTVGFDPYLGFYHQPRFGRAALALDLMEPFRPLIADSAVLSAINTRMVGPRDFVRTGDAVALKPDGRKAFFRAYEQRMDTLVTHPLFGYRVNYRRVLEIQARLLERVLRGELSTYPVFTTR